MKRKAWSLGLFAAAMLALATSAGAVDGTIEINQAKVMAAGGFPYLINSSGSYRLTGNLTVPSSFAGISVNASHVTIDLNGFSIIGPGGGSAHGISTLFVGSVTVENGTVTGFGADGVFLKDTSIVKTVHADSNGSIGISVGDNSLIEGCTANSNGLYGIFTGNNAVIEDSTATANASAGIYCNGSGCTISGNAVNGSFSSTSSLIGIKVAGSAGLILRNTITTYSETGIFANDTSTGYGENVFNGNVKNVTGGTSMGNNVCSGTLC